MQITYETMKQMFPKVRYPNSPEGNCAQFGPIPMSFFDQHEQEIRKLVCNRIIYRGPRRPKRVQFLFGTITEYASMTRRSDATHALVY
jgi:hypothetical protein